MHFSEYNEIAGIFEVADINMIKSDLNEEAEPWETFKNTIEKVRNYKSYESN